MLATVFIIVIGKSIAAFLIVLLFQQADQYGADDLGEPRADRRIFLHSRRPRRRSRPAAGGGTRPDPCRRDHLDHHQPAALLRLRPASGRCWKARSATNRPPRPHRPRGFAGTAEEPVADSDEVHPTALNRHAILVGYGRVGSIVGQNLKSSGTPFLVIEDSDKRIGELRAQGDRSHQRQRGFARSA